MSSQLLQLVILPVGFRHQLCPGRRWEVFDRILQFLYGAVVFSDIQYSS